MPQNPLGVLLRKRRAGHHTLAWARPELAAPENFELTSPAFEHATPIPPRHRGRFFAANISPALAWTPPPEGTASLVLVVQDPDVPWQHAMALVSRLARDDVVVTLVKDGDHRLSRPEDIARILRAVDDMDTTVAS